LPAEHGDAPTTIQIFVFDGEREAGLIRRSQRDFGLNLLPEKTNLLVFEGKKVDCENLNSPYSNNQFCSFVSVQTIQK
jgi:hypothetical protein